MTRGFTSARGRHHSSRGEGGSGRERKLVHVPVLLREALEALDLRKGDVVVDATAGMGGHSEAIVASAPVKLISLDADPQAATAAQKRVGTRGIVLNANFADMQSVLAAAGVEKIDKVLFDLGWNMTQLGAGKGFSFLHDEPLDMSYGPAPRSGFTAAEALNTWSEKVLADAIFGYGEERYARRIAAAVVERRTERPFATTIELVETITDAVPAAYRRGRIHPATRTFQALRIAVNDELGALEQGLKAAWHMLACGGRIAVITFHSVEDRAVKRAFATLAKKDANERAKEKGRLLYKKPLTPSAHELASNPSARSAKLRAIEKVCDC